MAFRYMATHPGETDDHGAAFRPSAHPSPSCPLTVAERTPQIGDVVFGYVAARNGRGARRKLYVVSDNPLPGCAPTVWMERLVRGRYGFRSDRYSMDYPLVCLRTFGYCFRADGGPVDVALPEPAKTRRAKWRRERS